MVRRIRRSVAVFFALVLAVSASFSAKPTTALAEEEQEQDEGVGVHAKMSTFEKNYSLTVAQKIYSIQKIERIVSFLTDPEMCDLEKYYKLALWENDHVTYDNQFWSGRYFFEYYRHQWDAYGALTDKSVCAGIAILYANLCHAADLPCKFVRTSPLDHTINYIPDINGNAYYVDVTENDFLMSEKACPFGDSVDKEFAYITKPCDNGAFEYYYRYDDEYDDDIDDSERQRQNSEIKECYTLPYSDWFNEYALHKNTPRDYVEPYVERGSGTRGRHRASYHDFPKQFSATEKPGIWFLEDFYKDPADIQKKIENNVLDEQLVDVTMFQDVYNCSSKDILEDDLRYGLGVQYFPSMKDNKIVAETTELNCDDYSVSCDSFDKTKGEAVVTLKGKGNYSGSYQFTVKLAAVNPMKVTGKTVSVKHSDVSKKTQKIKQAKALRISNAKGELSFKYVSATKGNKSFKKRFRINSKTGDITVVKGTKKGTYKVKVKVKAAGNTDYNESLWKQATVTIKIK